MKNPLDNRYDVGCVVGRFQVPGLSEGHKRILDNISESHKQMIIVLGVSPTLGTKKDPLGYTARMHMVQESYPKAIIAHILDVNDDELWSKNLDTLLRALCPIGSICLYGGRDSFIQHYTGMYDTFEFGASDDQAGSKIREEIGKEVINSYDFRAGIIYSCQNQYPKVFPTVDIAVIKEEGREYRVLMGKRNANSGWRFPGGFVDVSDLSFEEAALRELHEEIDVEVDHDSIEYVGSNKQNDHRYKGPSETISTVIYKVNYTFGGNTKDKNELCEVDWILVSPWALNTITPSHQPLFELLMANLKINASPYNKGKILKKVLKIIE